MDEVVFATKEDAEAVLKAITDIANRYELATVSDFYTVSGVGAMITYKDDQYGWFQRDLQNATVSEDNGKFKLTLPEPEYLS